MVAGARQVMVAMGMLALVGCSEPGDGQAGPGTNPLLDVQAETDAVAHDVDAMVGQDLGSEVADVGDPADADSTSGVDAALDGAIAPDAPADADATIASPEDAASTYAEGYHDWMVRCHELPPTYLRGSYDGFTMTTEEDLRTRVLQAIEAPGVTVALQQAFSDCAALLPGQGCGTLPEVCRTIHQVTGTLGNGEGCLLPQQCQSGACSAFIGTRQLCGQCIPPEAPPAPCILQPGICGPGHACDGGPTLGIGGRICINELEAGLGEPCAPAGVFCAQGLFCADICKAGAAVGETCLGGIAICDDGGFTECAPWGECAERGGLGAPCTGSGQTCRLDLTCDYVDNACRPPQDGLPLDSACGREDTCADGLACRSNSHSGTCRAGAAQGESCSYAAAGSVCQKGLTCAFDEALEQGVCEPTLSPEQCATP